MRKKPHSIRLFLFTLAISIIENRSRFPLFRCDMRECESSGYAALSAVTMSLTLRSHRLCSAVRLNENISHYLCFGNEKCCTASFQTINTGHIWLHMEEEIKEA